MLSKQHRTSPYNMTWMATWLLMSPQLGDIARYGVGIKVVCKRLFCYSYTFFQELFCIGSFCDLFTKGMSAINNGSGDKSGDLLVQKRFLFCRTSVRFLLQKLKIKSIAWPQQTPKMIKVEWSCDPSLVLPLISLVRQLIVSFHISII